MRNFEACILLLVSSAALGNRPGYLTCDQGNPFRRYIGKHLKVSILAKPSMTSSLCGDEWATFGNCCNEAALVAAAENDRATIANSVMVVTQEFANFIPVFNSFYDKLKLLSLADESAWSDDGVKKAIRLAKESIFSEDQVKAFDTLSDYVTPRWVVKYRKITRQCWNYIWKLRASSHCSTCSARGFEFFQGSKAIATDTACMPVIKNCYRSIKVSLRMLRVWGYLMLRHTKGSNTLPDLQIIFNGDLKLKGFYKLMGRVSNGGVASDIESIKFNFRSMVRKDSKHKGRFCDMFVKLVRTPFIVSIANSIDSSLPWILDFQPAINAVIQSVIAEKAALLPLLKEKIKLKRAQLSGDEEPDNIDTAEQEEEQNSRSLRKKGKQDLEELGPESMFDSDAIWPSEEKQFKMVFDDIVTNEHSVSSPMNLTLTFP